MVSRSPKCHVLWKIVHWYQRRFLKGFYHIWAWRPSCSCDLQYFSRIHFYVPESLLTKFDSKWPSSFWEKAGFNFLHINDFGPRSRNDPELQYSDTFINSISCLHLPTFRSQATIPTWKINVFTFSHRKLKVSKFARVLKR